MAILNWTPWGKINHDTAERAKGARRLSRPPPVGGKLGIRGGCDALQARQAALEPVGAKRP